MPTTKEQSSNQEKICHLCNWMHLSEQQCNNKQTQSPNSMTMAPPSRRTPIDLSHFDKSMKNDMSNTHTDSMKY
jgi:hypothetical protein